MSKWALVIDVVKCINCNNCVLSAKDEHDGNDFLGYAAAQPREAPPLIAMQREVRGNGLVVDAAYMPVMCNHCDAPPCVKAAGDGSVYKRPDGIVIMDPERTKGRRDIVKSCPYKAIAWNDERQVPQTWIFDAHLLDQGWERPRCAQACPTEAIAVVRRDDAALADLVKAEGLEVRHPEYRTRPRVFYKNMRPFLKRFVAANVVATNDGRVDNVPGAIIRLFRDQQLVAETKTDAFGDFKIDDLDKKDAEYRLECSHGVFGLTKIAVMLDDSKYLGTLNLSA